MDAIPSPVDAAAAGTTSDLAVPVEPVSAARRPHLHNKVSCVLAPATWVSSPDGQVVDGFDGLYIADRRFLTTLVVTVNGERPIGLSAGHIAAAEAEFVGVLTAVSEHVADPSLMCTRRRQVDEGGGVEIITLTNLHRQRVALEVEVRAGCDLGSLAAVQASSAPPLLAATATAGGLRWHDSAGYEATLDSTIPASIDAAAGTLRWRVELDHAAQWSVNLRVTARAPAGEHTTERSRRPTRPAVWTDAVLTIDADDRRIGDLVRQSLADLDALRLADPADGVSEFFAAGSPWFLTLFGRDALWSATLALPLGVETLLGTLRALTRRQGTRVDRATDEAPGKILHELRVSDSGVWPYTVMYGSIDSTPLFVTAVAAAWRWGAPQAAIADLMPAVERALHWLESYADSDRDGFIEYVPNLSSLANQGWKDSYDGVQWADGTLAQGPISLSEVQAYAYRAATDGADLLDFFNRPGGAGWRTWARELAARFGPAFALADARGPYPAIGLDRNQRPIDGPASNMGHLVGTGLVDAATELAIADRLVGPELSSGFGIRTLAATAYGFNPLGYHTGSVWPHDNAIAAVGLSRAGLHRHAWQIISQLLDAAPQFGFRLPELFGGHPARPPLPPVPYPPSCRPQAWTAALGPALAQVLLGLRADVPAGTITLAPPRSAPIGDYRVHNVRIAGGVLSVDVSAAGDITVLAAPSGVEIRVEDQGLADGATLPGS